MRPQLLIDGDIVIYQAACAAEKVLYILTTGDGDVDFASRRGLNAYVESAGITDYEVEAVREPEPFASVAMNIRKIVRKIQAPAPDYLPSFCLSSAKSFRKMLSPGYKANRKGAHKPVHLEEARRFVLEKYHCQILPWAEADDVMGIRSNKTDDIIASVDKDMLTVPGRHYNWSTEKLCSVSAAEADFNFWKQMIMGDRADNVKGIRGMGPVKAARYLNGIDPRDFHGEVRGLYTLSDRDADFCINYQLLHILRTQAQYDDVISSGRLS